MEFIDETEIRKGIGKKQEGMIGEAGLAVAKSARRFA
jgi:hypothetical protein